MDFSDKLLIYHIHGESSSDENEMIISRMLKDIHLVDRLNALEKEQSQYSNAEEHFRGHQRKIELKSRKVWKKVQELNTTEIVPLQQESVRLEKYHMKKKVSRRKQWFVAASIVGIGAIVWFLLSLGNSSLNEGAQFAFSDILPTKVASALPGDVEINLGNSELENFNRLYREGKFKLAAANLEKLRASDTAFNTLSLRYSLAKCYLRNEKIDKAIPLYLEYLKGRETIYTPVAQLELAIAYLGIDDKAASENLLDSIISEQKNSEINQMAQSLLSKIK